MEAIPWRLNPVLPALFLAAGWAFSLALAPFSSRRRRLFVLAAAAATAAIAAGTVRTYFFGWTGMSKVEADGMFERAVGARMAQLGGEHRLLLGHPYGFIHQSFLPSVIRGLAEFEWLDPERDLRLHGAPVVPARVRDARAPAFFLPEALFPLEPVVRAMSRTIQVGEHVVPVTGAKFRVVRADGFGAKPPPDTLDWGLDATYRFLGERDPHLRREIYTGWAGTLEGQFLSFGPRVPYTLVLEGWVRVDAPGTHAFAAQCDSPVSIRVGAGASTQWLRIAASNLFTQPIAVAELASGWHRFHAELDQNGAHRWALYWRPPGSAMTILPPDRLRAVRPS